MDIRFARFLKHIIRSHYLEMPEKILILGCGTNDENTSIKQIVNPKCIVIGIDIDFQSLIRNQYRENLLQMNGYQLGFKDNSFDCVFSYHVLEHIKDYLGALSEVKRVLKPNGFLLLGVPNKTRLLGYIGSNVTLSTKILWNFADFSMRIRGKFENKHGAHAGFTKNELFKYLNKNFIRIKDVTNEYFYFCYKSKKTLLKIINKFKLDSIIFPSIYFLCFKQFPQIRGNSGNT
ncbi:MAG: hypothetical protein B6D35_14655 [Candidatus Brocadia sp. UTAMX2]|jgi:ubiquinone/menaquinone biosynthesis C-methylase UbiE|nr:MAG: hypothetical protein B6D35_14655 [Candidatus Brocadia sp. UTAMX2]